MHELPVTESILRVVLTYANQNNVQKVTTIHLEVGEMSDLEDEWMQRYFEYIAKDSIASEAKLNILRKPVVMQCEDCQESFQVDIRAAGEIVCPGCKGKNHRLVSGREYFVKSIEVI
ncbi:MAG: hydrogenase maturation nickel metallochaperone HypA [Proteobacteria bacterium]|nr:hydrogenase maturation nickel metallochaperone HypA [Pseudomonadota bacterium]